MSDVEINSLDWQKMNGLLPVIIQHGENGKVIMLGYMNQEALIATVTSGQLNLYSRSRQRIWRKGESSGNTMTVQHISADFDNDSLLIHVIPKQTVHSGYQSSFNSTLGFLDDIISLINQRVESQNKNSYTYTLVESGINRCAQKVGEEAVETAIAAVSNNQEELINESADLIFHLLVLFKATQLSFYDVLQCLYGRDRTTHT